MALTTKTAFLFFIIFVIEHGTNSLSLGNVTAESRLIYQGYFNHSGSVDAIADRTERITTSEDINAIRGIDVSGQNGDAAISYFSARSIEILIWSDGIGRGFNFSVELYTNSKSNADGDGNGDGNGAIANSVSVILITISMFIGLMCFK